MTVAFDAATEAVRAGLDDPFTFSHTPSGTPRGVVLMAVQRTGNADHITGVTYGGTAMTRVISTPTAAAEPGRTYIYFLGGSVPSGVQDVVIDNDGTDDDMWFVCVTLTGAADLEIVDSAGYGPAFEEANPSVTLQYGGRECMAVGCLFSGHNTVSEVASNAGQTRIHDQSMTGCSLVADRQTSVGTADFTIGWTVLANDISLSAVAISEVTAAIAYRSGSTADVATSSLVLNVPAGVVDGDVMYALIAGAPSTLTIATPAGWTLLSSGQVPNGNWAAVYRRVAASEPVNYTWTWTGATVMYGMIESFRRVHNTTPEDAATTQANGSAATVTYPNITTVTSAAWHLAMVFENSGAAISTPTNYIARSVHSIITNFSREIAAAGLVSGVTSTGGTDWIAFSVALRYEAAAAPGGQPTRSMRQYRTRRAA